MVYQIGMPSFFITITAADQQWVEIRDLLLKTKESKMIDSYQTLT